MFERKIKKDSFQEDTNVNAVQSSICSLSITGVTRLKMRIVKCQEAERLKTIQLPGSFDFSAFFLIPPFVLFEDLGNIWKYICI